MFLTAIGITLSAVILFLVYPFWRNEPALAGAPQDHELNEERINLEIERQTLLSSLSDLEMDIAQARLSRPDYERLKLGYEHRLVKVLDLLEALRAPQPHRFSKKAATQKGGAPWVFSLILGITVAMGATGVYTLVHWKIERRQAAEVSAASQPQINPAEMVARLEKRLKDNPNDLQGQLMAGRSYMALERWDEAKKAWQKALELDPRNDTAHYSYAEVLIRTSDPNNRQAYEEALTHLDQALINVPQDAAVLWAKGVVLIHLERYPEADTIWSEAYRYVQPGTESADFIKKALQDLRAGKAPLF